jgi:hypothetical protein
MAKARLHPRAHQSGHRLGHLNQMAQGAKLQTISTLRLIKLGSSGWARQTRKESLMARTIDVMHNISTQKGLSWEDEDMLCILCSFVEHLIKENHISTRQFQAFLEETAKEDKAALQQT